MKGLLKRYVGDRAFYKTALAVAVPVILQMSITNLVSLLDNVMVGRLGTESMSGVSIVNQFVFIFNLVIFGALSGAGIFTSQYYGKGDEDGVRHTFRLKLIFTSIIALGCALLFLTCDDWLINTFLHEEGTEGDLTLALSEAKSYMLYTVIGLLPYALTQCYASTLRETRQTVVPMISGFIAVGVNFLFNLVLIFGLFGFPALGVVGAALATVLSRFVELGVLAAWTHSHPERAGFIRGALRSLRVPLPLLRRVLVKAMPIMLNELVWSGAMTLRNQCYSTRGLEVLAAVSIATTVINVLNVIHLSMASSIGIIAGMQLGAGEIDKAKDTARKMTALGCLCALAVGGFMAALSGVFPLIYDVGDKARDVAAYMMTVSGAYMVFYAYNVCSYYAIRSGGRVLGVMAMDSGFMIAVAAPITAAFAYFTGINVFLLYAIGQGTEILKTVASAIMVRKFNWALRMVRE